MNNCGTCYWRNPASGYCPKKGVDMEPDEGLSCRNWLDLSKGAALATMTTTIYQKEENKLKSLPKKSGRKPKPQSTKPKTMEQPKEQTQKCRHCGKVLPLSEFPIHKGYKSGRSAFCYECDHERRVDAHKVRVAIAIAKHREQDRAAMSQNELIIDNIEHSDPSRAILMKYSSRSLVDELRARGYEVTCTRNESL